MRFTETLKQKIPSALKRTEPENTTATTTTTTTSSTTNMPSFVGQQVGGTGYGLMGFTWRDEQVPDDQAFEAMRKALEVGANFWDGGEFYGPPTSNSLHLLNRYFTKYPGDADKVVLSIKGGMGPKGPDGTEEGVRRSVDNCLKVLGGTKKLDLFECARVDPNTPIEVSIRTLASYIKEGKLGGISLSECSANSIRRAAKVHKIEAVEVEFSMFQREILENGVAKTCGELGIPIVAYSPLGRGFLTGQIKSPADLPKGDSRTHQAIFAPENFESNMNLTHEVEKVAKRHGVSVGNVAIAWIKAQSGRNGLPTIIPIPGATTASRVAENGTNVTLTDEDLKEIDVALSKFVVKGDRYPAFIAKLNFGDSPEE